MDPIQSFLHGLELSGLRRDAPVTRAGSRSWGPAQFWAETVFVAICHSTNWDKLHSSIDAAVEFDPDIVNPSRLSVLSPSEFVFLTGLADPQESEDSARRQAMLRDLGHEALTTGFMSFLEAFEPARGELGGENGAYAALSRLSAYAADPLQKKARVLIHQWISAGSVTVPDSDAVAPAVDYHLIRLYLRSTRIHPRSRKMLDRFREGKSVSDSELEGMRAAVEAAMTHTAVGAGLSIADLNHYEWQIARSYCVRSGARCSGPALAEKPVDPALASLSESSGGCPFRHVCRGASEPQLRSLVEPKSKSDFY